MGSAEARRRRVEGIERASMVDGLAVECRQDRRWCPTCDIRTTLDDKERIRLYSQPQYTAIRWRPTRSGASESRPSREGRK